MQHIAIDLGGRESQICVRSATQQIVEEKRVATRKLGEYLKQYESSRVIVETSAEAFAVADAARAAGHEVRVVPATLARTLGVAARGIKTDRRDAQALSEVSCKIDLPSVHIPSDVARQRRAVCNARDALVQTRTKLVNTAKSQLRGKLVITGARYTPLLPEKLRTIWLELTGEVPSHVEWLLVAIEALNEQIKAADKTMRELAKSEAVCTRLRTVPGVGPNTAVRFHAVIDDVTRFGSAHAVQSYLGMTPGENSSSARVRRTRLTKAGSPQMRFLLVQAAWTAIRTKPNDPMVLWAKRIAERRGKAIAAVALARKIAGVMFALWRDGSTYNPAKGTD